MTRRPLRQHAWRLYPLRLELTVVAADGRTRTEQWQLDTRRVAFSVSLLALLKRQIRMHNLDLVDIDLRPRPDTAVENMKAHRHPSRRQSIDQTRPLAPDAGRVQVQDPAGHVAHQCRQEISGKAMIIIPATGL